MAAVKVLASGMERSWREARYDQGKERYSLPENGGYLSVMNNM